MSHATTDRSTPACWFTLTGPAARASAAACCWCCCWSSFRSPPCRPGCTIATSRRSAADATEANLETARATAAVFDTYVDDIVAQETAAGLALTHLSSLSHAQAQAYLRAAAHPYPPIVSLSWVSPEGQVLVSTQPRLEGARVTDTDWFRRLRTGGHWTLTNMHRRTSAAEDTFTLATVVRETPGHLAGVVAADVKASQMEPWLRVRARPRRRHQCGRCQRLAGVPLPSRSHAARAPQLGPALPAGRRGPARAGARRPRLRPVRASRSPPRGGAHLLPWLGHRREPDRVQRAGRVPPHPPVGPGRPPLRGRLGPRRRPPRGARDHPAHRATARARGGPSRKGPLPRPCLPRAPRKWPN